MAITVLQALERNDKPKRMRKEGFIPAVIYGEDYKSGYPIAFKTSDVKAVLNKSGKKARVFVSFNGNKNYGVIKHIDKDAVTGNIIHVDIYTFKKNDLIKLKVPITFTGTERLINERLVLNTSMSEVEVSGQASFVPEFITIDLDNKKFGDVITVAEISLPEGLNISEDQSEIVASINA